MRPLIESHFVCFIDCVHCAFALHMVCLQWISSRLELFRLSVFAIYMQKTTEAFNLSKNRQQWFIFRFLCSFCVSMSISSICLNCIFYGRKRIFCRFQQLRPLKCLNRKQIVGNKISFRKNRSSSWHWWKISIKIVALHVYIWLKADLK